MNFELSLCLIVRNEEPYLRNCVESFGAIDDELIIVDTGSTDGTVDIARELLREREGRLEHYTWSGDFAAARNHACSLARAPWILMVDGDEYLSPDQSPRVILDAIRGAGDDILNLLLVDLTLHEGRVILAHPVNRLFRNHPQVRWVGRIHESLTVAATQQRLTGIKLIHDNARKRREDASLPPETSRMYEQGLLADARATPENPRPVFYLGNTLAEREDWSGALRAYESYLELAGDEGWSEEVWQARQVIAVCHNRLGDPHACREALLRAVAVDPRRSETYLALGDCALEAGDPKEARIWYQFAATLSPPTSAIFVDTHAYGLKPWWKLGTVLIQEEEYAAALVATERALEFAPQDAEVRERLSELRIALKDEEEPPTVIVLSRSPELAGSCLEALLDTEGDTYYETILVCDGGTEEFEPLRERFPRLELLAGEAPFVYARNANRGIDACTGDVVLLNDDAAPETRGWLDVLRAAAWSRPDAGPVSPLLSESGNPSQDARLVLPPAGPVEAPAGGGLAVAPAETPFVTFACVYLRRDLIDRVGHLDPGFVWYGWEDNDFCQRASYEGFRPLVTREALVRHDSPSSSFRSPMQSRLLVQARHYFERKHLRSPALVDLLIRIPNAGRAVLHALDRLLLTTPQDCRLLVVCGAEDREFADALKGLSDPRLALRFDSREAGGAALLDELGAGAAEVVAEIAPGTLLPEGWLDALLRGRPFETARAGVLALPGEGSEPEERALVRVGGRELLPGDAADPAFARAPVHLVSRLLLDRFGPLGDSRVPLPPWPRLAERLERRGHVNGFVWPLVRVGSADDAGAS